MNKEVRLSDDSIEIRAVSDEENKEMIIEGYAIVFNSPATYDYTEVISERALDTTDMSDVVLRYNHNDSFLCLARTRDNSLELIKDEKGLRIKAKLNPNISTHRDIYEAVKAGLLDKMSFAFSVNDDSYDYDTNTRTINSIKKLYDVSVVDQPFYDSTSVYARSIEKSSESIKELRSKKEELEQAKQEILAKLG